MSEHSAVSSLLAAWMVHACDPREADAVEAHLRTCETCRAEVRVFARAAEGLAGTGFRPAEAIRDKLLSSTKGPQGLPGHAQAYAATVASLDSLLRELDEKQWTGFMAYERWSVLDLVIHLTATDNLVADQLGLRVHPAVGADEDPDSRTDLLLSMPKSVERAWPGWRNQADAICDALTERDLHPDLVVSRAFETWIHARDIALVTRKALPDPPAEHLHTIADFAAHLLPHAAECRQVARDAVRLVLSGPGGGRWTLPLAGTEQVTVEMTLDVTEFCLLMGGRLEPRAVDVMIRGDVELGYDLLDAGPVLAPR